VINQIF